MYTISADGKIELYQARWLSCSRNLSIRAMTPPVLVRSEAIRALEVLCKTRRQGLQLVVSQAKLCARAWLRSRNPMF